MNEWVGPGERAEPDAGGDGHPQASSFAREPEYPEELRDPRERGHPEQSYPEGRGHPQRFAYPPAPEYPRGPGYAPIPQDHPDLAGRGYAAAPSFAPGPAHAQDPEYAQDTWGGRASGTAQDPGYGLDTWGGRASGSAQDPGYGLDTWGGRASGSAQDPQYGQERGPAANSGHGRDSSYTADSGYAHDADALPPMEPLPDPGADRGRPPWDVRAGQVPRPGTVQLGGVPSQRTASGLMAQPSADPEYERETSESLTAESLLHSRRPALGTGWRRSIYRITGGLLRFGESATDVHRRVLINRVRTPVADGHHRVAVLSLKGGVGKTTTAVGLGATLATLRGDRVIAIDANPDRGTLSYKLRLETAATIRDLLNERDQIRRYADVRAFTSQAPSRLEVLASDRDPGVSVAFGAADYCDAVRVLEHFYSICLTDCGTGLLHSAMAGVLRLADQIVVVSSPSVDGARSASATLDWLEAHNCGDLVRNGVVVLSTIRPRSKSTVDLDRLEHHFATRCRAVARIPYDPHLEEGAEVELELLGAETADAYLNLAAMVGDGLAWPRGLTDLSALP